MRRIFDAYCGGGGCTRGYLDAGFDEAVGVDVVDQPRYPGVFIKGDALEVLERVVAGELGRFDAIHASPPCQAHSVLQKQNKREYVDMIPSTRALLEASGLPYVIENVEGAPLVNPVILCGSSFGLSVKRHRLFETNWPLLAPPCAHPGVKRFRAYHSKRGWQPSEFVTVAGSSGSKGGVAVWREAMGIDWMTAKELAQAIPPAYTEAIGLQLLAYLSKEEVH